MMDWINSLDHLVVQWGSSLGHLVIIGVRILAIATIAYVVKRVLHKAVSGIRTRLTSSLDNREDIKRAETLSRVVRYLVSVVVSLVATMLILSELGISLAPILGAAGVVGLAVGFGAQSLVKDYFAGFFLLLENQVRQGDVVTLTGLTGTVEEVTLRYVQLRDYAGNVYFIPNGQISTVTNMTREFGNAVIDIGVSYQADLEQVMSVMHEVAARMRRESAWADKILADLEMAGVESWADSAVMIRCRIRCVALEQWGVRREYLKRLKQAFDQAGIEIPFPHLTVLKGDSARS